MSDIRARLADALRKHYFSWPNHSSIGSDAHCQCGKRPCDWSYWADHAADVLLSLPSTTIVDMNELVALHDLATDIHSAIEKIWDRAALPAAANAADSHTQPRNGPA